MKRFKFGRDLISFISILVTFIALIAAITSPDIFDKYFIHLAIALSLVILGYIINYFRIGMEMHEIEINKLNEKINIYKDISDLKAKFEILINNKMGKKAQGDLIEIFIRLIQIGAIIFAGYIILKVLGVNF